MPPERGRASFDLLMVERLITCIAISEGNKTQNATTDDVTSSGAKYNSSAAGKEKQTS